MYIGGVLMLISVAQIFVFTNVYQGVLIFIFQQQTHCLIKLVGTVNFLIYESQGRQSVSNYKHCDFTNNLISP